MHKASLSRIVLSLALAWIVATAPSATRAAEKSVLAKNFTLKNLAGNTVSLDQYRGKYLLLNFWATWCGPCKIEMPSLEALYQRFRSDRFDVVGISNDMFGAQVVRPFVKATNISFPILLDQRLTVSHQYGVVSLPTSFLIDPHGEIIGVLQGAEDWSDPETLHYFESLLKKANSTNRDSSG
jgi:peroxiredoxin